MTRYSLFAQQDVRSTFDNYIKDIIKDINSKTNEYIINVDEQEWKEYYVDRYTLIPLEIDEDNVSVEFASKGKRDIHHLDRNIEVEYFRFAVMVPYTGTSFLFMLKPSTWQMKTFEVDVPNSDSGYLKAEFELFSKDESEFKRRKDEIIRTINANINNINLDVVLFNNQVKQTFDSAYMAKKKKVLDENSFFDKLNIKINKSTDTIYNVPVAKKKKIPEPIIDKRSSSKSIETPVIEDALYQDIIKVIYQTYKSVEKKPSIYKNKGEEDLRDYILPILETRYESSTVTGETFNKSGKTDILIRYKDGTNLFVAECKIWKGKAVFSATINQLFDKYLTWRDSKVSLIFFVENKEFSKVLDTIEESAKEHEYYIKNVGTNGESSFSYVFHFPKDNNKYIYTEVMAFHFPKE